MFEQLFEEGLGGTDIATGLFQGPGPGRQIVPARTARGLGIWGNHINARANEIAPVTDLPWITLAHQEDDGGGIGAGIIRQARLPIRRQELGLLSNLINIIGQGQGYDIGLKAIDHGTGLFAGAAMALVYHKVLADPGLPIIGKGGVYVLIELAGWIITDIEQGHRAWGSSLRSA